MKQLNQIVALMLTTMILISCGDTNKKDKGSELDEIKAKMEKLRSTRDQADEELQKLQLKLEQMDSSLSIQSKARLVSAITVSSKPFKHYIDLQGQVDAQNISYISPRGMGGQVKAVYVKEGQHVRKGQLLLKLDDAIMQQQVTAARQQLGVLKTQLDFSRNLYQRQKNLWDQGIGTEVQYITAKTNVESLENQLKSAQEQVQLAVEQLKTTNVVSDVDGIADIVNIRVGETFTGMTSVGPQIKIVNKNNLKVTTSIPENYLVRVHTGTPVIIEIPDANKTIPSSISLLGQSIDPNHRGFVAEVKIPSDPSLKPSQVAMVRINDYSSPNAVVIPINTVQTDETGKYVYLLNTDATGKTIAKKQPVSIGMVYGDQVEILAGLKGGEKLITEGYQNVYDGQVVNATL